MAHAKIQITKEIQIPSPRKLLFPSTNKKPVNNVLPSPYAGWGVSGPSTPFGTQQALTQASSKLVRTAQAAEQGGSKWDTASPPINPDWSPARGDVLSSGFGSEPDGDKKCQTGSDQWPVQTTALSDRGSQRRFVKKKKELYVSPMTSVIKNVQKSFCSRLSWWPIQLLCPLLPFWWRPHFVQMSTFPMKLRIKSFLHYWHFAPDNSLLWGLSCAL